jgi:hypothetical protein
MMASSASATTGGRDIVLGEPRATALDQNRLGVEARRHPSRIAAL